MNCGKCGAEIAEGTSFCAACGQPVNAAPVAAAPVQQTSGMAIASLVLGILGFCTGGITSLIGLILGIVSMAQISASKDKLRGSGLAIAGIVVSVISVIAGVVILIALIFYRGVSDPSLY